MTLAPPSPRLRVSNATRPPCPRDSYVNMPPSSSSGCAVTISKLVRVWSFCKLCQSAAMPRSKASGCADGIGFELTALGDWARTGIDRTRKGSPPRTAKTKGNVLPDRDAIRPPYAFCEISNEMFRDCRFSPEVFSDLSCAHRARCGWNCEDPVSGVRDIPIHPNTTGPDSSIRFLVQSNGIVRPQRALSTQNTKTFWHPER